MRLGVTGDAVGETWRLGVEADTPDKVPYGLLVPEFADLFCPDMYFDLEGAGDSTNLVSAIIVDATRASESLVASMMSSR